MHTLIISRFPKSIHVADPKLCNKGLFLWLILNFVIKACCCFISLQNFAKLNPRIVLSLYYTINLLPCVPQNQSISSSEWICSLHNVRSISCHLDTIMNLQGYVGTIWKGHAENSSTTSIVLIFWKLHCHSWTFEWYRLGFFQCHQ